MIANRRLVKKWFFNNRLKLIIFFLLCLSFLDKNNYLLNILLFYFGFDLENLSKYETQMNTQLTE